MWTDRRRPARGTAVVAAVLLAIGCGEDEDDQAADDVDAEVTIRAVEAGPFVDVPDEVAAGDVTLRLVNDDDVGHSVQLEELDAGIDVVAGGEEATTTLELTPDETYTYYCDVPGHRDLGMEGTFTAQG